MKKSQRYHRKILLCQRKVAKKRKNIEQNGRPEMIAENGRFPAETGGLESLQVIMSVSAFHLSLKVH